MSYSSFWNVRPIGDPEVSTARLIRVFQVGAGLAVAAALIVAAVTEWHGTEEAIVLGLVVGLAVAVVMLAQTLLLARRSGGAEMGRVLTERAELTRRILDRSHEAYVAMDAEGNVMEWNE